MIVDLDAIEITNALQTAGFSLSPAQFTFSIPNGSSIWPTYGGGSEPFSGLYSIVSPQQANAFGLALGLWDSLIAPDFSEIVETSSAFGEIRVAFTGTNMNGIAGYAYSGTPQPAGSKVGDIWINANSSAEDFSRGTQNFETFVHEIGHTLGLKHPFDAPVLDPQYNSTRFTVMAYAPAGYYLSFSGTQNSIQSSAAAVVVDGPMVIDIAAAQAIYGAETSTATGNDTYQFTEKSTVLHAIYDAGGIDTIDVSNFTLPNMIDLRPGAYSSIGYFSQASQRAYWKAQFANFTKFIDDWFDTNIQQGRTIFEFDNNLGIAQSTTIENAFGGAGNDSILGNDAANELRGNNGNDTLEAGKGNDIVKGGAGTDIAVFSGNRSDYTVVVEGVGFRLTDQRAGGGDGSDLVDGIEHFLFADGNVIAANLLSNSSPLAVNDSTTTSEDLAVVISVLGNDNDPNGDTLSVTAAGDPPHGTTSVNGNGTVTYTPDLDYNGQDSFTYTISDGKGGTANATVTVTVLAVNDAPTASATKNVTTSEDVASVPIAIGAADVDGDVLTYGLKPGSVPAKGSVGFSGGFFTYTPSANANGADSFIILIQDGHGGIAEQTVSVTINSLNDAPVADADGPYAATEDALLSVIAANGVLAGDSDVDGDSLTAILVSTTTHGTLTLSANGAFTYQPAANFNGVDSFSYQAQDSLGAQSAGQTVTINVGATNDAPVADADGPYATSEDTQLIVTAANGVLAGDSDADGDSLTAQLVSTTANGTLALSADGAFTYTPAFNFNGADSFTYQAKDPSGALSAVQTATVIVSGSNDAPLADADGPYAATEDMLLSVIAANGVLAGDSDADGDTLTAILVSNTTKGTLTLNPNGAFTYQPAANFNGADSFSYQAKDPSGALSAVQTITINIAAANDTPVADGDGPYAATEDTLLSVTATNGVLAGDSDADGDSLTAILVSTTNKGMLTLNADGSFAYQPGANFNGADGFSYQAKDSSGALSAVQTISINVAASNDAPDAVNDGTYGVTFQTALVTPVATLLANDTDVDSDSLTVTSVQGATHGTVGLAVGQVTFTPATGYSGEASYSYTISDGHGGSDTATVNLLVGPQGNVAPTFAASSQAINATAGTSSNITASASDVDGDSLTYTIGVPAKGSASIVGNAITYIPKVFASGSDSFVVTASDGKGGTAAQTINVTIAVAALPPSAFQLISVTGKVAIGGNGAIAGTNGVDDVSLLYGAITLDGSFNRGGDLVRMDGNANIHFINRSGSSTAIVTDNDTLRVAIPLGLIGLTTVFDDGTRTLLFDGANYKIGAQNFDTNSVPIIAPSEGAAPPTTGVAGVQDTLIMAGAALQPGQSTHVTIGGKVGIAGANGTDVIAIADTGGVFVFDGSFNRGGDIIVLNGNGASYTATRQGSSTMVIATADEQLTIPIGTVGLTLRFADGDRTLVFSNGKYLIGTQEIVGTTPNQLNPPGAAAGMVMTREAVEDLPFSEDYLFAPASHFPLAALGENFVIFG